MKMSFAVLALACAIPTAARAETINNQTVLTLNAAGVGDEAIIAKIKTSPGQFDLSTDQIIELKRRGISGPVIAAMLASSAPTTSKAYSLTSPDPMTPHPMGVYLMTNSQSPIMNRIDATVSNQAKTGGILGYALTYGIASMSVKAALPGETARVKAENGTPVFYMFFPESNPESQAQINAFASGGNISVSSPNEFTLVRLAQKKGRREARVGSLNIGGAKTGVMDKAQIPFDYNMVRPGVYKVTAKSSLSSGEYGFLYSLSGGNAGGALTARVFDFSIP